MFAYLPNDWEIFGGKNTLLTAGFVHQSNSHVETLMERNNLTSNSKGAVELDYSFPIYGKMKGYAQYLYGYGESLIDYNARSNRIGVGIAISDWF